MGLFDLFLGKPVYKKRTVSYKGRKFNVEVADSFRKIAIGLMNHTNLPKNAGMLFIFSRPGRYGFWMLHMKFKIDIIWLDESGRVVHMWENAEPSNSMFSSRTVTPNKDALYVLEFNAGTAARLKIKAGSRFAI